MLAMVNRSIVNVNVDVMFVVFGNLLRSHVKIGIPR